MPAADPPPARPPVDPTDDPAVRARLAESHVAIVGCGGLGSNAANMLVRSGVGTLTLIDFDVVDESNLNRQLFFRDQLGTPKTEALAETLRRISPRLTLILHAECATEKNLVSLVGDADVVIEAADRVEVKAMVPNVIMRELPMVPVVAASGLAGVDSANQIVTERLAGGYYVAGDLSSDVRHGLPLLASRVMTAAAHEAHAAIRILLGYDEP